MKKVSITILVLLLILAGCNEDKDNATSEQKHKQQSEETVKRVEEPEANEPVESFFDNLSPIPQVSGDIIKQAPGMFASTDVLSDETEPLVKEEIKDLPVLKENATEEELNQYFNYVYSMVAEDFPDPKDLINKWEFALSGSPDVSDPRYAFKENYNVEIILDASGSMAAKIGGKTRMELAKSAIQDFLSSVPEEANVSLRVYGHTGSNADSDKKKSCSQIDQVYGFKKYDESTFTDALNKFKPTGWTPIAAALEASKDAFKDFDASKNTNLIYLVSDGIETCDGNPVEVAKSFADSNVSPIINVIGLNVDSAAQRQLKSVADSANGVYTTVSNEEQLREEFERAQEVLEKWEDWKNDSISEADAQRVDNNFDILGFSNDWSFTSQSQSLNISYFISIMKEEGKITFEQSKLLKQKGKKLDDLIKSTGKELVNDLEELNLKKVDELKQKIEEKYQSGTQS